MAVKVVTPSLPERQRAGLGATQPRPALAPALPVGAPREVVRLMTKTYAGFNDVRLTEKLQSFHALSMNC